jgi:predicted secreted protein
MKSLIAAGVLVALSATFAAAQTMTCADYLKAEAEMAKQMGSNAPKLDGDAAAMDKKMKDFCTKNPTVSADKAMEEAMK